MFSLSRRYITPRVILIAVCLMVATHLVLLGVYTQSRKAKLNDFARSSAIQQVMNVIHMVKGTPPEQLAKAIQSLNMPDIQVDYAEKPAWPLRVTDLTFWRINRLVPRRAKTIELSLYVPGGHWVNVQSALVSPAFWPQLLLFFFEGTLAIIVILYIWSITRFTEPLKKFKDAAMRLGVEFKPTQLEEFAGPQVVRETAQAMNQMQQRISDLLSDRTLMLAALSHDLRTPITRLKLRANLIDDPEHYTKTIRDLDEMDAMIAEVLDFARNDYHHGKKSKLDLKSLLQSICDDLSDLDYNVTFETSCKRLPFKGYPAALKRALNNLIHNALKYGHCAKVKLANKQRWVVITIEDDGPGIPEDEIEKVFIPFYRCDQSRSRKIAGTGLGLAVARDAIRAHGGDIHLENIKPHGLRVIIEILM